MCEPDGPFVAGFVAGEGHFAIRPNNAGQSWACAFYLTQREDNAALVRTVRDLTGCGEISRIAARATSRPQAVWKVESIRDCVHLERYLDAHPLLAKKAGEFRVWQRGVAVWAARSAGPERWPAMKRLASELLAVRQPTYAADFTWVDITRPYLEGFLAGLTTAEGHYGANRGGHPRFVIKLRGDDTAVLALLAATFRCGRLVPMPATRHGRAQTAWMVTRLDELPVLVDIFDRHPPLGRAGEIYVPWRRLVLDRPHGAKVSRALAEQIRATRLRRVTDSPGDVATERPPRKDRCIAALDQWATECGPPFTATSYEQWRRGRAGFPSRNTVARVLGSWRAGLVLAGLPTDRTRTPEVIATCRSSRAPGQAKVDRRHREAVIRSVERCVTSLGRAPGASEYLRWRLRWDPGSPAQASIYRLFPGGWQEVLEAVAVNPTRERGIRGTLAT
jgi:hypothetical protein